MGWTAFKKHLILAMALFKENESGRETIQLMHVTDDQRGLNNHYLPIPKISL
jgi:hypothetical protein